MTIETILTLVLAIYLGAGMMCVELLPSLEALMYEAGEIEDRQRVHAYYPVIAGLLDFILGPPAVLWYSATHKLVGERGESRE